MTPEDINEAALKAAHAAASNFNSHWGGSLLQVQPDQAPVVDESALLAYASDPAKHGWYATQVIFTLMFPGRVPTHAQLIRLGRQMSRRFPRYKDGPRSYYWLAPDGTPPGEWR